MLFYFKSIQVNDWVILFNLLIGLNGYIILIGVFSVDLNGNEIIFVLLECEELINVGWISYKSIFFFNLGVEYVKVLYEVIGF